MSAERVEERNYWCRRCSREKTSRHVPAGWYSLVRYAPDVEPNGKRRPVGLGLFCSTECLLAQVEEMGGVR